MTNIATIEDVFENVLGLVLGGAPGQYELASGAPPGTGRGTIKNEFRPANAANVGFWLIAEEDTLDHDGAWTPEYDKDAVTFYWYRTGANNTRHYTRLTVWVGLKNRKDDGFKPGPDDQTANSLNPADIKKPGDNPVVVLGNAWELLQNEIPNVIGANTSFDPETIDAARLVLTGLANLAASVSTGLHDQTGKVNSKGNDFRGSAEAAWFHQVQVTNSFLSDLGTQHDRWEKSLLDASNAAADFVTQVKAANEKWFNLEPKGTWQHPFRMIAAMFNQSKLSSGSSANAWNVGHATPGGTPSATPTYTLTLPPWLDSIVIDPFKVSDWSIVDRTLRSKWHDNLVNTWQSVVDSANNLVAKFGATHNQLFISDPAPVAPLPMMPMPNPNGDNPFANIGNPFANIGDPFANIGNPFAGIGDPFAGIGNPFANQPFVGASNPFANSGDGLNGPFLQPEVVSTHPFANVGDSNPFMANDGLVSNNPFAGSAAMLGDLTPTQLNQLLADGQLKDTPLTPQQAAFLESNGLGPVPPGATLGDLTPRQLDALQKAGLLDQTATTPAELKDLGLGPTPAVPLSQFPTGVDGVQIGNKLQLAGGVPLGDVSGPGALALGYGGVGTGGLLSVPGLGGSPGGLSAGNLGPLGEPLTGAEVTPSVAGEALLGEGMGGLPYMPGMFGGGFGGGMNQGQGQRERTRGTWLKEDEEVWGTEPEVAPAVVGRKGRGSVPDDPEGPADEPSNLPGESRPYRRR
jgi:hypothetical protein